MQEANIRKSFSIIDCNSNEDIQKGYKGEVHGILSKADFVDSDNQIITSNAIQKALNQQHNKCIALHLEHQREDLLGHVKIREAILEKNGDLRIIGRFLPDEDVQKTFEDVKNGKYRAFSVGATVSNITKRIQYIDGVKVEVFDDIKLIEASIVERPANRAAVIDFIKSMQKVDHFDSKIQWKSILKTIAGYELSNDVCDELWAGMHSIIEGKIRKSLYEDIKKEIQRDLQTEATTVQKPVDNHCVSTEKLYTNTAAMLKKYNIVI